MSSYPETRPERTEDNKKNKIKPDSVEQKRFYIRERFNEVKPHGKLF